MCADPECMCFDDNEECQKEIAVLKSRIEQLEDAIELAIEEFDNGGDGYQKVGGETLIEFMTRTLGKGR